jgi:hypothetical protein
MRAAMLLVFVAAIVYDADAKLGRPLTGTSPQVPALGGGRVPPAGAVPPAGGRPAGGRGNQTGVKPGRPGKPGKPGCNKTKTPTALPTAAPEPTEEPTAAPEPTEEPTSEPTSEPTA